jgi:hypothetical protein
MQSKYDFEAVDRTLRDIRDCEEPFGGLPVILGGDFAQILPVVKRANCYSLGRTRCGERLRSRTGPES